MVDPLAPTWLEAKIDDQVTSRIELPELPFLGTRILTYPDRGGAGALLRACAGVRLLSDWHVEVRAQGKILNEPLFADAIYVGPYSRYAVSWRAATVEEEILTSITEVGRAKSSYLAVARYLLRMFHIAHAAGRHPSTLSGGEAQRLAILLALVSNRRVIVLDHSFSEQDEQHTAQLRSFLDRFAELAELAIVHRVPPRAMEAGDRVPPSPLNGETLLRCASAVFTDRKGQLLATTPPVELIAGGTTLVVGANGSGKSLLCRLILGSLPSGVVSKVRPQWTKQSKSTPAAYVPQEVSLGFSRESADQEIVSVPSSWAERWSTFPGRLSGDGARSPFELTVDQQKYLATITAFGSGAALIVFDEPSEHWDDDQLAHFCEDLRSFADGGGCIFIASHDHRLRPFADVILPLTAIPRVVETESLIRTKYRPTANSKQADNILFERWHELHEHWPSATLDLFTNWKDHVDPVLRTLVRQVCEQIKVANLLDVGCGNGLQTLWLRRLFGMMVGNAPSTIGVDWQVGAVEWARFWARNLPDVEFYSDDLNSFLANKSPANHRPYCVVSAMFVVHDLPNAAEHFAQAYAALPAGGAYIGCILNPDWVYQRRDKLLEQWRRVPMNTDANFVADYRLPESYGDGLSLPYFHRSAGQYETYLRQAGFDRIGFNLGGSPLVWESGLLASNGIDQTLGFVAFK